MCVSRGAWLMKAILVTGANKGIGLALVERLLTERDDTHVVLAARSKSRGDSARDALVARTPAWGTRLEVVQLDAARQDSVTAAATHVRERHGHLYGLVNNAGVADADPAEIVDVNLNGVKRVSDAFAPLLQRPGGRLVHISSGAGPMFVAKLDDERRTDFFAGRAADALSWEALDEVARAFLAAAATGYASALSWAGVTHPATQADIRYAAYGFSKAAVNVLVKQHARAWPELVCTACSPGFIVTDLTRAMMQHRNTTPEAAGALPVEKSTVAPWKLLFATDGVVSGRYYGSDGLRSPVDKYRAPGTPEYEQDD